MTEQTLRFFDIMLLLALTGIIITPIGNKADELAFIVYRALLSMYHSKHLMIASAH